MAKKPTFISPSDNTIDAPQRDVERGSLTRLYRDPADATADELKPSRALHSTPMTSDIPDKAAGSVTKRVEEEPLEPAPAHAPGQNSKSTATRMLATEPLTTDAETAAATQLESANQIVGWLVIVDGPGRGQGLAFATGMNAIGAGADNDIVLNYGDEDITQDAHAYIVYDEETRAFHATHAGQNSVVRLNDKPLLEAADIANGATLRIGKTSLRLVTLCGPDFDWSDS